MLTTVPAYHKHVSCNIFDAVSPILCQVLMSSSGCHQQTIDVFSVSLQETSFKSQPHLPWGNVGLKPLGVTRTALYVLGVLSTSLVSFFPEDSRLYKMIRCINNIIMFKK